MLIYEVQSGVTVRSIFSPLIDVLVYPIVRAKMKAPIQTSAGQLSQQKVDAIVSECGGAPGMVTVNDGKLIILQSEDRLVTSRVLEALRATGETSLSSVENVRYSNEE